MPITQAQMIEQMQEARAAHKALRSLRETLLAYCQSARARYPANAELQEVLLAIDAAIQLAPLPDDRATYVNERHYARRAKWNNRARERQERQRREAGIPKKEQAMEALRARNAPPDALPDPFSPTANPSRPEIIFPRDAPDDKDLDFEGEGSDSLFGKD